MVILKLKQLNPFFFRCQFLGSESHNLHGDFFLIDPPVISFDRESELNFLLYVSDEFKNKINKEIIFRIIPNGADDTGVADWAHSHPIFCVAKIFCKAIKRISPRRECYSFSNVYCLILECLEFKYFSVFHHPSTLKSILPALPNLALIWAAVHRKLTCLKYVLGGIFSYVLLVVMT